MKKGITLVILGLFTMSLTGCGNTYDMEIESGDISRKPNLKANMEIIDSDEENGDVMFQEIAENENENLDTLVIASDKNKDTKDGNLSSYVQTSINELKLIGGYTLSKEKSKKTTVGKGSKSYPAILKTFNIVKDNVDLTVAQLFIEKNASEVVMLSYASHDKTHTKKFINELPSLEINF